MARILCGLLLVGLCALALSISAAVAAPTEVSSDFDGGGLDGWTVNSGEVTNGDPKPNSELCGDPPANGFLFTRPPGFGETTYFQAPNKFLFNWTALGVDEVLLHIQWGGDNSVYYDSSYGYRGDVVITNGAIGATAVHKWGGLVKGIWHKKRLPLTEDNWEVTPPYVLEQVLENVTKFEIRGEYGIYGEDNACLDNVVLFSPPPVPRVIPLEGVVEVNGEPKTEATILKDNDHLRWEQPWNDKKAEEERRRRNAQIRIGCGDEVVDLSITRLLFEGMTEISEAYNIIDVIAYWEKICADMVNTSSVVQQDLEGHDLTLVEGNLLLPARSNDLTLNVEAGMLNVQSDPLDVVAVAHYPSAGMSAVAVYGGSVDVEINQGSSQMMTIDQGQVLFVDESGPGPLQTFPQVFLPLVQ